MATLGSPRRTYGTPVLMVCRVQERCPCLLSFSPYGTQTSTRNHPFTLPGNRSPSGGTLMEYPDDKPIAPKQFTNELPAKRGNRRPMVAPQARPRHSPAATLTAGAGDQSREIRWRRIRRRNTRAPAANAFRGFSSQRNRGHCHPQGDSGGGRTPPPDSSPPGQTDPLPFTVHGSPTRRTGAPGGLHPATPASH